MQQRQYGNAVVIRANERKKQAMPDNPITYETVSPEHTESLVMFMGRAAPGQGTGPNMLLHGGDENLLILSGTVDVEVEGQKHTLGPGDSMFIPRGLRHRVTNAGTDASEFVFVVSPPRY